ncbi:hypothetical protein MKJ04_10680 [Pontibacter sp. E15-1]|uniref:hypothetical protein n=1 Tax=Pontibacter sp. E15-1 TaxID=2919918 RepID=UPI001F4F739C|nr:hypothetical protein [Pontibacter sp. E15-1]MCJ8165309.1 hypothetical protein [Pontibacter sp. E15-1]
MVNYICAALLLLLLTRCQQETSIEPGQFEEAGIEADGVQFGQEITLPELGQVTLYGEDVPRKLYLSARKITDSRCPEDVTCITYGAASIVLSASNSQGKNEDIQLCIGSCDNGFRSIDSVTAVVGETLYSFSLIDVTPFPERSKAGVRKKAKLLVEKIGTSL